MTTTLIIARHGNTFAADQTPTRVGARTDLPLVEKGVAQGAALGRYLKEHALLPDRVYASRLERTQQTAQAALQAAQLQRDIHILPMLDEIDYGPDENKPEAAVIARIGAQAVKDWDDHATPPDGWAVDPQAITQSWIDFANDVKGSDQTILLVTSNGTARFAPYITGDFDEFKAHYPIKLATGALGVFTDRGRGWQVEGWNIRPKG